MINLIPPAAKRGITIEYWKRVIAVWLCLFSTALVILAVFLLPTFIVLQSQIGYLQEAVTAGVDRVSRYDVTATELTTANKQAALLLENQATNTPSALIQIINTYAGNAVTLNNFQFSKLDSTPVLVLSGVAATRQDLARFRDVLDQDTRFVAVDLPISNLIRDKDLLFSMEIEIATST
jgi:hypothetical protein